MECESGRVIRETMNKANSAPSGMVEPVVMPWDIVRLKDHTSLYRAYSLSGGKLLYACLYADELRHSDNVEIVEVLHNASITGGGTPYRECNGSALALAKQFHDTYERLAPSFGYETRPETRDFDPDSANGRLMVAVCQEIIEQNPTGQGRSDCGAYPGPGCSVSESKGNA